MHHWQDPPERRRHHAKGRVAAPATGGFGLEVVVAWVDGQVEALTWTALRQPATPLFAVAAGHDEVVVWMLADDGPTIQAAAGLLRVRARRSADAPRPPGYARSDASGAPNFASQAGPEGLDMGPGRPGAESRT